MSVEGRGSRVLRVETVPRAGMRAARGSGKAAGASQRSILAGQQAEESKVAVNSS